VVCGPNVVCPGAKNTAVRQAWITKKQIEGLYPGGGYSTRMDDCASRWNPPPVAFVAPIYAYLARRSGARCDGPDLRCRKADSSAAFRSGPHPACWGYRDHRGERDRGRWRTCHAMIGRLDPTIRRWNKSSFGSVPQGYPRNAKERRESAAVGNHDHRCRATRASKSVRSKETSTAQSRWPSRLNRSAGAGRIHECY